MNVFFSASLDTFLLPLFFFKKHNSETFRFIMAYFLQRCPIQTNSSINTQQNAVFYSSNMLQQSFKPLCKLHCKIIKGDQLEAMSFSLSPLLLSTVHIWLIKKSWSSSIFLASILSWKRNRLKPIGSSKGF